MRPLLGVFLLVVAWGLTIAFLHNQWQDKERQHREIHNAVTATTYDASITMYRRATELFFAQLSQQPEVIDTFAQGVKSAGIERDKARGRLYRLLAPIYRELKAQGIPILHFHTTDGHSFLRVHAPHLSEDPLFDLRPSLRLANHERRTVFGFEAGRITSGFRYVFPIFKGGEHLGSMEASVTFRTIREAMTEIDPSREYALVLRRDQVDEVFLGDQRKLYEASPLNDDFLVEAPLLRLPDSPPPPNPVILQLDTELKNLPQVREGMAAGATFTVPLHTASGDWTVSFVSVRDILGHQAAYVVAYIRDPLLATMRHEFHFNMVMATLSFGAFAWFTWGILRSRAGYRQEKQQLQIITDTIADGLYVLNRDGQVERVNPTFTELLGYSPEEVTGKVGHEFFHVDSDGVPYRSAAECPICSPMARQEGYAGEGLFRCKDGALLTVELSCRPIRAEGRVNGAVTAFRDISERKANEERIHYLAQYDTLTNLPNRALCLDRLQQTIAMAQREGGAFAVLFIDVDHFKNINDSLGHLAGDKILQETANRLVPCVRSSDTVSRQGGDEFIIILSKIRNSSVPAHIAGKILAAMEPPFVAEGQELRTSVSIGIALFPEDGQDTTSLIKNADAALYHAKKLGRNNYQFFTADLDARARQRLKMENSLRLALDRREFLLHYQPLVDLESGRIIGAEALLRWQHPELGLVPPGEFIPLAEDCGLIVPIGEWVLREACRQNKIWQDEGLAKLPVAVNLSPLQFRQRNLEEVIRQALAESGLAPEYLEIEITESLLMSAEEQTIALLYQLKNLGLSIAIDDFGTGYSSLSYIKVFPIDKLKIDRSFVREVSSDPNDAAIISAIIAMAQRLRLRVLAEGVETIDQRNFLMHEGCTEAQGYHYSRPLPADGMENLLRAGQSLPQPPAALSPG